MEALAQGKVEADETSAPNGDGLQQLSEDGTASLVTTTTVTEQASAQASVAAVATASQRKSRNKLSGDDSAVARAQLLKHKQSSYRSRSGSFFANQASAQETQTTEQASQGQTSTQVAVQTVLSLLQV